MKRLRTQWYLYTPGETWIPCERILVEMAMGTPRAPCTRTLPSSTLTLARTITLSTLDRKARNRLREPRLVSTLRAASPEFRFPVSERARALVLSRWASTGSRNLQQPPQTPRGRAPLTHWILRRRNLLSPSPHGVSRGRTYTVAEVLQGNARVLGAGRSQIKFEHVHMAPPGVREFLHEF